MSDYDEAPFSTTKNFQSTCKKFFDADLSTKNKTVSCGIPPRAGIFSQTHIILLVLYISGIIPSFTGIVHLCQRGYIGNQGTQMYGHSIHRETYCYGPESFNQKKTLSHAPNHIPRFISLVENIGIYIDRPVFQTNDKRKVHPINQFK